MVNWRQMSWTKSKLYENKCENAYLTMMRLVFFGSTCAKVARSRHSLSHSLSFSVIECADIRDSEDGEWVCLFVLLVYDSIPLRAHTTHTHASSDEPTQIDKVARFWFGAWIIDDDWRGMCWCWKEIKRNEWNEQEKKGKNNNVEVGAWRV